MTKNNQKIELLNMRLKDKCSHCGEAECETVWETTKKKYITRDCQPSTFNSLPKHFLEDKKKEKWEIIKEEHGDIHGECLIHDVYLKNKDGIELVLSKTPDDIDGAVEVKMIKPHFEMNVIMIDDSWEMTMDQVVKKIQSGKYDFEIKKTLSQHLSEDKKKEKWEIISDHHDNIDNEYSVHFVFLKNKSTFVDAVELEIGKTPDSIVGEPNINMIEPFWWENVIEIKDMQKMSMDKIVKEIQSGKYDFEIKKIFDEGGDNV